MLSSDGIKILSGDVQKYSKLFLSVIVAVESMEHINKHPALTPSIQITYFINESVRI